MVCKSTSLPKHKQKLLKKTFTKYNNSDLLKVNIKIFESHAIILFMCMFIVATILALA